MTFEQIAVVLIGALVGGMVNGLTGFGYGLTAIGIWLYAVPPVSAATLVLTCSVVSHILTFPMIRRSIVWKQVLPFILPGLIGVPIGTWLLPHVDARTFKLGVGLLLAGYSGYALLRPPLTGSTIGGKAADWAVGFGGGAIGGLSGLSGALPVILSDIRAWAKDQRRTVLQTFNFAILSFSLVSHAATGLITPFVMLATAAALPGTVAGASLGAFIYRRLGDRGYQRIVMDLLFLSGALLLCTSW